MRQILYDLMSKQTIKIKTHSNEIRFVVSRGGAWVNQMQVVKGTDFQLQYSTMTVVNTAFGIFESCLESRSKEFSLGGKSIFSFSCLFNLYEMMDVNETQYGNHFTIQIGHVIMLYTLNLHSTLCQLQCQINLVQVSVFSVDHCCIS